MSCTDNCTTSDCTGNHVTDADSGERIGMVWTCRKCSRIWYMPVRRPSLLRRFLAWLWQPLSR